MTAPTWRKAVETFCTPCDGVRAFLPTRLGGLKCRACGARLPRDSKMGNIPTRNKHTGRRHDSRKEADRATTLLALERSGKISDVRGLHRTDSQEEFVLAVYARPEVDALLDALDRAALPELAPVVKHVRQSLIRVCRYRADFTYTVQDLALGVVGERVVEDVKSRYTAGLAMFNVKRALMLASHGIEVQVVER